MNKLPAALLLALCTLTASADVAVEAREDPRSLLWLAPIGLAIAIFVAVKRRRSAPRAEP